MDENDKRKFDSLEVLRKATWDSYQVRSNFEWKIAISLWTAEAAFIGIVLTRSLNFISVYPTLLAVGVVLLAIIALHVNFVMGIAKAHLADRNLEYFYRGEMWKVTSLSPPPKLIKQLRERGKEKEGASIFSWGYLLQIGITFLLGIIVVAVFLFGQSKMQNVNKPQDNIEYHIYDKAPDN